MEFEIKVNDILTFRNGEQAMVYSHNSILVFICEDDYDYIDEFNNDLTANEFLEESYDIMKIQRPEVLKQLIKKYWKEAPVVWERKEKPLFHGMTYEEAHRAMWKWLAENPEKTKEDWFDVNKYEPVDSLCFACVCCDIDCKHCPLGREVIGCSNGLFNEWKHAYYYDKNYELASQYANIIAQLPWREVE